MQWKITKLTACQKETLVLNGMQSCSAGAKKTACTEAAEYRSTMTEAGIVIHEQHYCELHKDQQECSLALAANSSD
jgi:hypothetical protein